MYSLAYAAVINRQSGASNKILGPTQATNLLWQEGTPHRSKQASRSLSATLWIWHRYVQFGSGQHQLLLCSLPSWWCWWNDNCFTRHTIGRSVIQSLLQVIQVPNVRQLYHRRTRGPSNPPAPTTIGSSISRRVKLYAHANQYSKTISAIRHQVIRNHHNHSAWDAGGGPSGSTSWPKIYTRQPPRYDTPVNEGCHETMERAIWGCGVEVVIPDTS